MKRGNGYTRGIIAVLAVIVIFLAGYIANDIRRDKIIKEVPESAGSEKEQVTLTSDERLEAGSQAAASNEYIGEEKAKEIALNHAGVSESDANFVRVKLDYDHNTAEYEIEFWSDNKEYDYDINAVTGEILSFDYDAENYAKDNTNQTAQGTEYISEEEAKAKALEHAGINEADAGFVKSKFEYDDGIAVYEIEFYSGKTEYEYKINAVSGEIIEYDVDNN